MPFLRRPLPLLPLRIARLCRGVAGQNAALALKSDFPTQGSAINLCTTAQKALEFPAKATKTRDRCC
jgi:hypothetical protein